MFGETEATVFCSSYEEDSFLEGYIRLNNTVGLTDNAHPNLEIHTLVIPKTKIIYYVIGDDKEEDDTDDTDGTEEIKNERKKKKRRKKH